MSRPRLARRNPWTRVTNELVVTFALKDCPQCKGEGIVRRIAEGGEMVIVCACCDAPFKEEYRGRLRRTKGGKLEFRRLAEVAA